MTKDVLKVNPLWCLGWHINYKGGDSSILIIIKCCCDICDASKKWRYGNQVENWEFIEKGGTICFSL